MHTDNDAKIADLIAQRENQRQRFVTDEGDAQIINSQITEINLQIMKLQGKQAHQPRQDATAEAVKSLLTDAGNASALKDAFAGIEEKIVWTTKDGNTWPTLEEAIRHQRIEQIIAAMVACGHMRISCIARQVAENADEIFAILEPFFRKGE